MSWDHMLKFKNFLEQFNFPFPQISAMVSVYVQLVSGIMFVIGWRIRYAAIFVIINFTVALVMVHRNDSFETMTAIKTAAGGRKAT